MGVMVSFQKQEGKKREINSYRDPKSKPPGLLAFLGTEY